MSVNCHHAYIGCSTRLVQFSIKRVKFSIVFHPLLDSFTFLSLPIHTHPLYLYINLSERKLNSAPKLDSHFYLNFYYIHMQGITLPHRLQYIYIHIYILHIIYNCVCLSLSSSHRAFRERKRALETEIPIPIPFSEYRNWLFFPLSFKQFLLFSSVKNQFLILGPNFSLICMWIGFCSFKFIFACGVRRLLN